jgi:hypothetical protein
MAVALSLSLSYQSFNSEIMDMEESKAIDVQEKVEAEVHNGAYLSYHSRQRLLCHTDNVQPRQTYSTMSSAPPVSV